MTTPITIREGAKLWEPRPNLKRRANITRYINWLKDQKGLSFGDYNDLWRWSVSRPADFWASVWDFFEIQSENSCSSVMTGSMPTTR